MLYGSEFNIYMDHKNLTFRTMSVARIIQWCQIIEGYDIKLQYLQGKRNVLAHCFSHLTRMDKPTIGEKELEIIRKQKGIIMSEEKEIKGLFKYEKDSKRYHRFQIETDAGIVGTIYVPKDMEPMPKKLILEYSDKE